MRLEATIAGDPVLSGALWRPVRADESVWLIQDGVLEITLLKESRRGNYADGETNADTFWRGVLLGCPPDELIPGEKVPASYYTSLVDAGGMEAHRMVRTSKHPMIDRSHER